MENNYYSPVTIETRVKWRNIIGVNICNTRTGKHAHVQCYTMRFTYVKKCETNCESLCEVQGCQTVPTLYSCSRCLHLHSQLSTQATPY